MSGPTKGPEQGIEKSDSSIEGVIDAATKMPKTQKNEVGKRLETSGYSDKRETTENKYGIVEYKDQKGQSFWHLNLAYNEKSAKYAENPQLVNAFIDMVTQALFMDETRLVGYIREGNNVVKKEFAVRDETI